MGKFDKLALAVDEPEKMIIVHPHTRQPLRHKESGEEGYIELYSSDSDIARKHSRNIQRRRLNMRGRGKLTPEEIEAEATSLLVALTVSWNLVGLDGDPLDVPFTQENARELYSEHVMAWLREQVDEFTADRSNFSQASSTNSSTTQSTNSESGAYSTTGQH